MFHPQNWRLYRAVEITDITERKRNDRRTNLSNWKVTTFANHEMIFQLSLVSAIRKTRGSLWKFLASNREIVREKKKNELRQCFNRACYFEGKRKYEMPLILDVGIISLGWWTLIFVSRRFAASPPKGEPLRWHFSRETERERTVHIIRPRLYEER